MARVRPRPVHDLARDLRTLAAVAASADSVDDLLRRGLDWLGRLVPYDLATVFELRGDQLWIRVARGPLAGDRVRHHSLDLADFPTIREVIETRRARAYTEHDHSEGDGDPFDGVLDLPPGHSCMVVPLCAGDACFGVTTLDRSVCGTYPAETVELAEVYAQILAIAVRSTEQKLALERLHRQDHERLMAVDADPAMRAERLFEKSASPAVLDLAARARQVAATEASVLVIGEPGVGKRRLARAIHGWSPRADQPLIAVDCAALPAERLAGELSGRAGALRLANGGTLLVTDVDVLPLALQQQLAEVLGDGCFVAPDGASAFKVDVRVIATSSADLRQAVAEGRFREDLYYRLAVSLLELPPLRARAEDLPLACGLLLAERAPGAVRRGAHVTAAGIEHLARHAWPGNLTELANVLERAAVVAKDGGLGPEALELPVWHDGVRPVAAAPVRTLADVQRDHISSVLIRTGGRIYGEQGAAHLLGLKPSTLQSRMQKLGLDRRAALARSRAAT